MSLIPVANTIYLQDCSVKDTTFFLQNSKLKVYYHQE